MIVQYEAFCTKDLDIIDTQRVTVIQASSTDGKFRNITVLPDTGAYLTMINWKDLKDVAFKCVNCETHYSTVGGFTYYYKLYAIDTIYLGSLQLKDAVVAVTENLTYNLLGTNIMECLKPLFDYENNLIYFSKNIGRRALTDVRTEWRCGGIYLQEEVNTGKLKVNESKTTDLTEDEEKIISITKNFGKSYFSKTSNMFPGISNPEEVFKSLVDKGILQVENNFYTLK